MNSRDQAGRPASLLLATEVAALGLTMATVIGFARLFGDDLWIRPLLTSAVAAHIVMALVRRWRRGLLAAGTAGVVGAALDITWSHYFDTTTALLPTNATRAALDLDLEAAWTTFGEVKAPTPSAAGFLVLASVAIWVIVYLADWAAFRLWSPLETVLPGFALFVFIAFFGTSQPRLGLTAVYLAALVLFQLLHHMVRQAHSVRWLSGSRATGTMALLAAGVAFGVLVVAGAVLVGPKLPGAESEAIVDLDGSNSGQSSRVVPSPIVDIRGRIVNQADVEAFTVDIGDRDPTYWRLASLDYFDGAKWGTTTLSYDGANGRLDDDGFNDAAASTQVEQTFTIGQMGSVWVPAAFRPISVSSPEFEIGYEAVSGTLITKDGDTSLDQLEGTRYSIVSSLPSYDPSRLTAAPTVLPPEIAERYLQLPADFSQAAADQATALTAGAATTYDKALALQTYFQAFTYDIDVGAGSSSDRIDEFLLARRGYCEQFAAAFAAMARSLDIPARVAVGFTWGEYSAADGLYHVTGKHAHAWPEVYIPQSGWVAFEPTPGRGLPGGEAWTNVPANQAGGETTGAVPTPTPATTGSPLDLGEDPTLDFPEQPVDTGAGASTPSEGSSIPQPIRILGLTLGAAVLLFAVYAALVIGAKRTRARRRLTSAADTRSKVGAIWRNTVDVLEPLDLRLDRSETVHEFSLRAGESASEIGSHLQEIADVVKTAMYAPEPPDDAAVAAAALHHDDIVVAVENQLDLVTKAKSLLDPRPLVRR